MSSVTMKRRKRREKGTVSVRSLICAFIGAAGLAFLIAGIIAQVLHGSSRKITGVAMLLFFTSFVAMCFGIRYSKREGYTLSSRIWGVALPAIAFAGYAILYVFGLLSVL